MNKKEIDILNESIDDVKSGILSPGEKTRRILKSRNIVSPSLKGMIQVSTTPPTWIVPNKKKKKVKKSKKK
jgi:hypothetical protein